MPSQRISDIRELRGLKNISWLTSRQIHRLADTLTMRQGAEARFSFHDLNSSESIHVLLSGIARVTCNNRKDVRSLVIMVAPGVIPGFPPPVAGIKYSFRCEAVTECHIGTASLKDFIAITLGIASTAFTRVAASYAGRWDLVQLRCANFMGCSLEERIVLILLELSDNFGIPEKRGVRLTTPLRQQDVAELVGATRPRFTVEYLAQLEREHMIVRDGRQVIVQVRRLENFLLRTPAALASGL